MEARLSGGAMVLTARLVGVSRFISVDNHPDSRSVSPLDSANFVHDPDATRPQTRPPTPPIDAGRSPRQFAPFINP